MFRVINPGSPRHEIQLQKLGEFLGLAEVEYVDWGNGEDYILRKPDGTQMTLNIRGNRVDGGFMAVADTVKPITFRELKQLNANQ